MRKSDLVRAIMEKTDLPKREADRVLNAAIESIFDADTWSISDDYCEDLENDGTTKGTNETEEDEDDAFLGIF